MGTDGDRRTSQARRAERRAAIVQARRRRRARAAAIALPAIALLALAAFAVPRLVALRATPAIPLADAPTPAHAAMSAAASRAVEAARLASRVETISIVAVGDMLFDAGPRRLIAAQGGSAPLVKVATLLRDADLTIGNLESTLSNRGEPVEGKPANLIFNGDPRGIASLTDAGFDVVSIANNHAMDHGAVALGDTIRTLDAAHIMHAGAGPDSAHAWAPAILTVGERRVAYVAASQVVPAHFESGAKRPGVANGHDVDRIVAAIRAARKQADIVIVSVHWGTELSFDANEAQRRNARRFIDAGADAVLSHHPHVMQGIDSYKGKLIAYSLGNFLFPYKSRLGRTSFILRFDYGEDGFANVTAVPVVLGEWGRPSVQTGADARETLGKLAEISKPLGTSVTIRDDIGHIRP